MSGPLTPMTREAALGHAAFAAADAYVRARAALAQPADAEPASLMAHAAEVAGTMPHEYWVNGHHFDAAEALVALAAIRDLPPDELDGVLSAIAAQTGGVDV